MHIESFFLELQNRREKLEITQEDLAKLSGVSLRTIIQIESGKGNPTIKTIQKIGDVLGLSLTLTVKNNITDETS